MLTMLASRRALLTAALASRSLPSLPARAAEWSIKPPADTSVYTFDTAPKLSLQLDCLNVAGKQQVSIGDFLARQQYVVLWFFPSDDPTNNEIEARNFQRARAEFDDLDAVVLGCSEQTQKTLVEQKLLTIPFVSDPRWELATAYGARNPAAGTFRQTFIVDPSGTVRFIERNLQYGVGNFNLDNHCTRVLRELYRVRNGDGWAV